jgi:hypothetical protein
MAGFRSSFSPLFWLHHNNVDRFYEAYLSYHADSESEFRRHQRKLTRNGRTRGTPGFPDGPCAPRHAGSNSRRAEPTRTTSGTLPTRAGAAGGDYYPFVHPTTGKRFHARDSFDTEALGYVYDNLPRKQKQQMREAHSPAPITSSASRTSAPLSIIALTAAATTSATIASASIASTSPPPQPPYYAVFEGINVLRLEKPRVVYVFVADKTQPAWALPAGASGDTITEVAGYAGSGSIFFFALEQGACENCFVRLRLRLRLPPTSACTPACTVSSAPACPSACICTCTSPDLRRCVTPSTCTST